jgi:hypothetical protein
MIRRWFLRLREAMHEDLSGALLHPDGGPGPYWPEDEKPAGPLPATLAELVGSGEVILISEVPYEGLHFALDPAADGGLTAVRVTPEGVTHVVPLETARPVEWLTGEQIQELEREIERCYLENVNWNDEQVEIVDRHLEPYDEAATADSYARAMAEARYETGHRRPLDPEGAAVMTMHVLAPDDGGPMRTACCGRLLEELPVTEGVYRHASVGRATCRDLR